MTELGRAKWQERCGVWTWSLHPLSHQLHPSSPLNPQKLLFFFLLCFFSLFKSCLSPWGQRKAETGPPPVLLSHLPSLIALHVVSSEFLCSYRFPFYVFLPHFFSLFDSPPILLVGSWPGFQVPARVLKKALCGRWLEAIYTNVQDWKLLFPRHSNAECFKTETKACNEM